MLLKQLQKDSLSVSIFDSRKEMGNAAGNDAAQMIRSLLSQKEEVNIIFAAAPSQNETLDALVAAPDIDWSRVNAFHMDEYIGLSSDAPQGFGNFLKSHIFSRLNFKNVFYLSGAGMSADEICSNYSDLLKKYPTDIVCLGIGENGHIAFNDPWVADFSDNVLVKKVPLDPVCRQQQVNDGCFETIDDVPEFAITLTIPALFRADYLFCTVPAATKAMAVYKTVNDPINEKVPATVMRKHRFARMYCDPDSGKFIL